MDHVYCHPNDGNYIRANSGSTEVLSILKENKQLKAMLLLHLDLIQEQSDQLMAKDRLLANLREENESLKLRLERMDKRLQKNKVSEQTESLSLVNSTGPDKKENVPKLRVYTNKAKAVTQISPPSTETSPVPVMLASAKPVQSTESKYKICDDNHLDNHIIGENNGKYITKIVLQRVQSPGAESPPLDEDSQPETIAGEAADTSHPDKSKAPGDLVQKKEESVIANKAQVVEDSFSCGSGAEQEPVGVQTRRKHPVRIGNLTTKKLYCTREWEAEQIEEDLNREETEALKSECPNLEIPKWTIKDFHGLYAIEGTEDLSDDVFLKRHNKLEVDEKRRKKWDVQRIREQRTIERLKRRHCKEQIVDTEESQIQNSFYPNPESIKFIQITEEIPVNAFGEIIPSVKENGFNLPWPDHSKYFTTNPAPTVITSTSPTSPAAATTTFDIGTRRWNNSNFSPKTSLLILKRRRRQYSQSLSNYKRSHRKVVIKN
ncbi:unnamed protein product [Hermetia illucens]|uniref:PEHE domain-containing protein n=2 Tax=Hermetia illucens TaxID=343691 RepID=A0A7R8UG80_HERIL|nr:unnamed protein product [Hermetia illucens]